MGEIADMMLDGTLCQGCGCYIDDEDAGYPRWCSEACRRSFTEPAAPVKTACTICGKMVKTVGLRQHMKDKHGEQPKVAIDNSQQPPYNDRRYRRKEQTPAGWGRR